MTQNRSLMLLTTEDKVFAFVRLIMGGFWLFSLAWSAFRLFVKVDGSAAFTWGYVLAPLGYTLALQITVLAVAFVYLLLKQVFR